MGSYWCLGWCSTNIGLDESQTIHAMGTAEYHAPLAPVMRPVTDKFHWLTQDVLDKARAEEIITLLSENLEGGKTGSITELVKACTVLHPRKG